MKTRVHKDKKTVYLTYEEYRDLMEMARLGCVWGINCPDHYKAYYKLPELKKKVWKMIVDNLLI